ncbi:hypothetical protein [Leptospira adleri]|nr:hypothetical protein [Leptospira adleri]
MRAEEEKTHLKAIQVDETQLKKDLSDLVRVSVEEDNVLIFSHI